MLAILKKILIVLWVISVIYIGYSIHQDRELLDPVHLLHWFQSFGTGAILVYIFISFIRGIFLLPSMPLVLVGVLFFPDNPHLVFAISMLGIVFSGILIYQFSDLIGFDTLFAKHTESERVKKAINTYGFPVIALWSFAPIVPTDLICYVAGTVRYNFWKFVLALTLGEGIIVGILIYGGRELLQIFSGV